jgi:hypothetical protein
MDMRVFQRGSSFGVEFPIGASSIPVGKGISKGNSVSLCLGCSEGIVFPIDWKNPKKPEVSWHTTFTRKSSVLYLCFRLALERGCLRHLLYGQIAVGRHFSAAVGQADFVMWVTAQMQDF